MLFAKRINEDRLLLQEQRKKIEMLEEEVNDLKKQAKERESFDNDIRKIRAEHHLAEQIQRSMLPKNFSQIREKYQIDIYADMDTAWEIGGDFYDFFPIDDSRMFFTIADVSGKSVSAAMFAMVVKTIIKMAILNGDALPDVAYNTSKQLYQVQTGEHRMFVTVWMGILDCKTGLLEFVNAGHEPPLYLSCEGDMVFCEQLSGLPLSSYFNVKKPEKSQYHLHSLVLRPNDALLLYTDGVSESTNREGKLLGRRRIAELTNARKENNKSTEEWIKYLQRHVISYANHSGQDDDITFLALRRL